MEDEVAKLLHYLTDPEAIAAGATRVPQLRADVWDLEQTATLVFTVVVMIDVIALGGSPADAEASFQSLDDAMDRCLWTELCRPSKRRLELPEELQYNEKQRLLTEELADRPFVVHEDSSSWTTLMLQPGLLANAAVRAAGSLLRAPPPLIAALLECVCIPVSDVLANESLVTQQDSRVAPLCELLKAMHEVLPDARRAAAGRPAPRVLVEDA